MPTSARQTAAAPQASRQQRLSCRVLLVEDNADSRETLRAILEIWGYTVEAVENGVRGVDRALKWRPEAAVVDIGLPGIDGDQVARRVRAALGRRIFLIALTGYCLDRDRRQALDAGFDVHMAKPADIDYLSRLLRAVAVGTSEN